MQVTTKKQNTAERLPARRGSTWSYVRQHWILYVMLIPGIIMFFLFMYKPMVGLLMAFEKYNFKKGIFGSESALQTSSASSAIKTAGGSSAIRFC